MGARATPSFTGLVFVAACLFLLVLAAPSIDAAPSVLQYLTALTTHHPRARPAHSEAELDDFIELHHKWNFLHPLKKDVNGGVGCAACTAVVGLLEQLAQLHNTTVDKAAEFGCKVLPANESAICSLLWADFGPLIIRYVEDEFSADEVCLALGVCKQSKDHPACRLFPPSHAPNLTLSQRIAKIHKRAMAEGIQHPLSFDGGKTFNICTYVPRLCYVIEEVADHLPAFDSDKDTFSTYPTLRGTYWRGKDCDDTDATIHPGRYSTDDTKDHNCNGIFGIDSETGVSFEDSWCRGTSEMGVAILGDSASAHFAIPPGWVTAKDIDLHDFDGLPRDVEDELDWPMFSWATGNLNTTNFGPDISGPVDSIYETLRRRNLCNTNDYQNLGVNGARSVKLLDFAKLLGRTNKGRQTGSQVKPMMLYMAMIGNDVCSSKHSLYNGGSTPVSTFYNAYKEAVLYADSVLEPGSVITLVGLADGSVLWDAMHARIHPIGSTNNDVTYEDLYNYLNCLHISPCWGWMNSNASTRAETTFYAKVLSLQLQQVKNDVEGQLKNTRILVLDDWSEAIKDTPYPTWQLIEPVDGFHPSQLGNYLLAKWFANKTEAAGLMPPPNPNNDKIKNQFPGV